MKTEVLVAAMHQEDLGIFRRMNLQSDAVIANQADVFAYREEKIDGAHRARMITTPYRGVGRNRNTALLHADGDVCVFADEDEALVDGYPELIREAFARLPRADMLIFNTELTGSDTRVQRDNVRVRRVRFWNAFNYGAPRIVVRRSSIARSNVWFSLLFGGGARYSAGEDSMFLADCIRSGMKIYTYPETLGRITQRESTWFQGYTEKYFRDKGAFFYSIAKGYARLLCAQDAFRHRGVYRHAGSWRQVYRLMCRGIVDYRAEDTSVGE